MPLGLASPWQRTMQKFATEEVAATARNPIAAAALAARTSLDEAFAAQDLARVAELSGKDLIVNSPRNSVSTREEVLDFFKAGRMNYESADETIEVLAATGKRGRDDGRGGCPSAGQCAQRWKDGDTAVYWRLAPRGRRSVAARRTSGDHHIDRIETRSRDHTSSPIGAIEGGISQIHSEGPR